MLSAQKYGKNLHVNYSPFGAILYGRNWSSEKYRYGFQGQEKDDEVSGAGNSYTAEFWQYSSRLAVRWNIDPIVKHFQSPYTSFSNNPIIFVDRDGDTEYLAVKIVYNDGREKSIKMVVSNKVRADGSTAMIGKNSLYVNKNNYYDFTTQLTFTENAQGDFDVSYKTIYHKELRKQTTIWFSKAGKGHTIEMPEDDSWQRGGIEFTSKDGRGNNPRTKNADAKSENIDMLINVLGGLVVKGIFNKGKTISKGEIVEYINRVVGIVDKAQNIQEEISGDKNEPAGLGDNDLGIDPSKGGSHVKNDSVIHYFERDDKYIKAHKDDKFVKNGREIPKSDKE